MAEQRPPRVFISYSHDSVEHAGRVLRLANELRRNGIYAIIDQYFTSPPEGWPAWMDAHIRDDDFVVMVCTETYYRRVVRKEAPGVGLGVRWEGSLIYNHLYRSDLSRFVPVLLEGGKSDHIPEAVAGASHYFVETPEGYGGLLRRLFNRPAAEMPPICERPELPVLTAQWTSRPLATLHGVPELPPHFLPRPEVLAALKEKLLATGGGAVGVTGVATKVGVQGMGGIGKSVLAAALARDEDVRKAFPAGVFWVPLGRTPNPLIRQADLYRQLTGAVSGFADAQQGRVALQEALRGRACLIVLDDVWQLANAEAFNIVDAEARLLLTTRDAAIVKSLGASEHEVGCLDRLASLRLLARTAGVGEPDLPAAADTIAEECGDLPLALALAGGMIGGQAEMWGLVLDALRRADIEQIEGEFPGYPYPHVFAAIEASVVALGTDRERYLDLAVFLEKVPVPEATLRVLWVAAGLGALKVRTLINRLRDRSLAALDAQNRLSLHDLQGDFVRKRATDLPARHQRLLDAWRKQYPGGWASGPDDGYVFPHLPYHLAQAGRGDEVRDLLLDYAWIKAKLAATDVPTLLADYANHIEDEELTIVDRALGLSESIDGLASTQLPSQLIGRLKGSERPGIRRLVKCAEGERGFPWLCPRTPSLIPAGPLLRTLSGHRDGARALALLPDGRRALSGSRDLTLRMWDLSTAVELRRFEGHQGYVNAVAVLPDGRRALSGSNDCTLRLWDLETGSQLRRIAGHGDEVSAVLVFRDGRRALSGSHDKTLRVWDLETGEEVRRIAGHSGYVTSLALLCDQRRALTGSSDRTLRLWDLETGLELRRFEGHTDWVSAIALLPNESRVLTGSYDGTLRVWDLETGSELRRFEEHQGWTKNWVRGVGLLSDGRRAISCSDDETLRLWDLETGAELRRFEGHEAAVTAIAILPDARRAVSCSKDGTLRVWDLETARTSHPIKCRQEVNAVAVLRDGKRALSASEEGTLRLWDLDTGAVLRRFEDGPGVKTIALLADGRRALLFVPSLQVELWDLETGEVWRQFVPWKRAALLPDGRRLLCVDYEETLKLWDLETGAELRRFESQERGIDSVVLSPDGRRALSVSYDRTLRLWDLETGVELLQFEYWDRVTAFALLADGRRQLFGLGNRELCLWDLEAAKTTADLHWFAGHEAPVTSIAPLSDGRRALSGSWDQTLRLWDLDTGECLAVFTGDAAITCVAVARDNLFVAGSANGAIHILDLVEPKLA